MEKIIEFKREELMKILNISNEIKIHLFKLLWRDQIFALYRSIFKQNTINIKIFGD
jgi:hypothetical protein